MIRDSFENIRIANSNPDPQPVTGEAEACCPAEAVDPGHFPGFFGELG